ncbi:hypothetical protein B0O41_2219 [Propionibacteriaceae bacterium ES.041]|nr:hypothetical protein B0O41_2219 [Propionibacteriaceae bacterium ES.041]
MGVLEELGVGSSRHAAHCSASLRMGGYSMNEWQCAAHGRLLDERVAVLRMGGYSMNEGQCCAWAATR